MKLERIEREKKSSGQVALTLSARSLITRIDRGRGEGSEPGEYDLTDVWRSGCLN